MFNVFNGQVRVHAYYHKIKINPNISKISEELPSAKKKLPAYRIYKDINKRCLKADMVKVVTTHSMVKVILSNCWSIRATILLNIGIYSVYMLYTSVYCVLQIVFLKHLNRLVFFGFPLFFGKLYLFFESINIVHMSTFITSALGLDFCVLMWGIGHSNLRYQFLFFSISILD